MSSKWTKDFESIVKLSAINGTKMGASEAISLALIAIKLGMELYLFGSGVSSHTV
jgi:hypothetical protein